MAVAVRFCGRCGAQLVPGAQFCGRCGAPALTQAVVAEPVYSYPVAQSAAYPTAGQFKLSQGLIAGALLLALAVVTVIVSAIAVSRFVGGSHTACTANCAPKILTPLPEGATYRSSAFNFQVNYSSRWNVRSEDSSSITLGTRVGSVQVVGTKGSQPAQALQAAVSALPSGTWQNVTLVSSLKGAHIGDQDGVGSLYSANLIGSSSAATTVRFALIAASRNGVTVVVFAVDPADPKSSPSGMPEAPEFDYLCTEFAWG
jgi:hypothetical protein